MKQFLKLAANTLALLIVSPLLLAYGGLVLLGAGASSFEGFSQALALLPGRTGVYLRKAFYRAVLTEVGPDVWLGFGVLLTSPASRLGARCYVGPYSVLGNVNLEDDVLVASQVSIVNGSAQHGSQQLEVPIREQAGVFVPITIGAGSWIGERAVVMASVGRQCIVGAGAVVTRPVADFAVVAGVPARVIRYRDAAVRETSAGDAGMDSSLSEVVSH